MDSEEYSFDEDGPTPSPIFEQPVHTIVADPGFNHVRVPALDPIATNIRVVGHDGVEFVRLPAPPPTDDDYHYYGRPAKQLEERGKWEADGF